MTPRAFNLVGGFNFGIFAGLLPAACCLLCSCAAPQASVDRLRAGYDALNARQLDQAMAAADTVLAEPPHDTLPAEAHYLRGRVFEERAVAEQAPATGDLQNARAEYVMALTLPHKPDLDGRLHAGAANVAFHQGDYTTALQQWNTAYDQLERPEDRALTLFQLGRTAQRLGRWEEADKYLVGAAEEAAGSDLAAKAKQIQGARGYTVQLVTFTTAKQADTAAAELRKQSLPAQHFVDPTHPEAHLLRVGPLHDYTEAIAMKRRFAALYPAAVILP